MQKSVLIFFFQAIVFLCPGQEISYTIVMKDTSQSFRGLSVVDDSVAWVGGTNGKVGLSTNGGKTWKFTTVNGFEKSDFRSIYAFDENNALAANAGSPACILRTNNGGNTWITVYTNEHKDAFFDGMDFWNDKNGLIYGDPIDGKLLVLETYDAGITWREIKNPPVVEKRRSFVCSKRYQHPVYW